MKYQQIGDILIFNRITEDEAREFLRKFARIKTICMRAGVIYGKLRKPRIKAVASRTKKGKTITIHKENRILYKIDVAKIMFAKGNVNERHRIVKIAKPDEIVADMFAGIGYFSLPLAKKVKQIYSIELNPVSYRYLLENIALNKLKNIRAIKGDCSKIPAKLKIRADRIVMGYLPSPFKYLDAALKISKKGTIIHYHCLIERKNADDEIKKLISSINGIVEIKLLNAIKVKEFSPGKDHYVLDLQVKK